MTPTPTLETAVAVLRGVPRVGYAALSDAELLSAVQLAGEARRLVDAHLALAAGELDRRSSHDLGAAGLARRSGARTPEELLTRCENTWRRDTANPVSDPPGAAKSGRALPAGAEHPPSMIDR